MSGNRKYTAAHFNEHGYCSTSYDRSLETSRRTVGQENTTQAANFYLEQRAPTFAPSRENGHLGYYSASGSTSHSQSRKRSRTASEPRNASASKKSPSDSSAPESHRISQRLQNRTTPLSSSSCNLPSTSSNSQQTKSRKSSDAKTSSGSKRSNFSKGQTAVLMGWLEANLERPYPSETKKLELAKEAGISLNQVNTYYTNVRRRPAYIKMCEEKGIIPCQKKKMAKISINKEGEKENQAPVIVPFQRENKAEISTNEEGEKKNQTKISTNEENKKENQAKISTSEEGEKDNKPPVQESLDSGLASDDSRRASANSSNKSPLMETSSPEIEASQDLFIVDAGINPPVSVFKQGSGFIPAPPLPAEQSQEQVIVVNAEASKEQVFVVDAGINPQVPVFKQDLGFIPAPAEQGQEHVFVVDAGINPVPSKVPVFKHGTGFFPAPPLPANESPEVLAVSRQVTDHHVYIDVPPQRGALEFLFSVVEMYRDADVKAYERNMPREHYIAERLLAETPGATAYQESGYIY